MTEANTLAYYNTVTGTAIKKFTGVHVSIFYLDGHYDKTFYGQK